MLNDKHKFSLIIGGLILSLVSHTIASPWSWLVNLVAMALIGVGAWHIWLVTSTLKVRQSAQEVQDSFEQTSGKAQAQLAYLGHEVRTPLNGIIGTLDILQNSEDPQQIRYMVNNARKSAENLLLVLNNNIDAAKFENGHLNLQESPFSLLETCENVARLNAINAEKKGLEFNLHFDPRLIAWEFDYDHVRLSQILNNLVGNAIKFTAEGHVTFWVSTVKQTPHKYTVRFAVEDSGPGISENEISQLQAAFYRVSDTYKSHEGAGLGLYISKRLLGLMNSKLVIRSTESIGSTFYFDLDLEPVHQHHEAMCVPGDSVAILAQRSKDIEVLQSYLTHWGFICHRLVDWDDPLIKHNASQLIIDQSEIPKYEQKLRQLAFSRDSQSIIVLQGQTINATGESAIYHFSSSPITKPILPSELMTRVFPAKHTTHNQLPSDAYEDDKAFFQKLHILCVDDVLVNQTILKAQLQQLGIAFVQTADNGQQAVKLAEKIAFDAILMDINMPVLDGIQATRILRERGNNTPVIGVTALNAEESVDGLDAGMNTILQKPINGEKLQICLRQQCSK